MILTYDHTNICQLAHAINDICIMQGMELWLTVW